VAGLLAAVAGWQTRAQETSLDGPERAQLDTFEGVTIDKADKVFAGNDYTRASAEYDAFVLQFPESKAVAYGLLRKGRSLQLREKRFEAIKVYQEILDFFPNDVKYAAAAAFRIGECHRQNGDMEKAMKAWLTLADDADYSKQPLAATALNELAENYVKQGKTDEGTRRYEQVAVDFRASNPEAAWLAIGRVVPQRVRTSPNLEKLRSFYVAARTFEHGPRDPGADLATDGLFWQRVREAIGANDKFTDVQADQRRSYYKYWAAALQGRMNEDDEQQIAIAHYGRAADGDEAAWEQRLDAAFAARDKPGNYARVVRWIGAFAPRKQKVDEYYRKLDFAKMSNDDIRGLVYTLIEVNREPELAANAFAKLRMAEMSDAAKQEMYGWFRGRWERAGARELAVQSCLALSDQRAGRLEALRYYHWRCSIHYIRRPEDFQDGLALAAELQNDPAVAKETQAIRGNLLQWSGKYEDAIKAYQQADNPPATLFWTAECQKALGRIDPAIAQLREIEGFFAKEAPEAALRIAYLYRDAGIQEKYVRSLRSVLKKYPKSQQSSEAHQRLEEMGLPIGGGVDADAS
jgi:TolA-binding protein